MHVAAIIVIAACLGFFVVLGLLLKRMQRQRDADAGALRDWATDHGWAYADRDDSLTTRWTFVPFGYGTYRHADHVVTGNYRGLPFVAFDYQYQDESVGGQGTPIPVVHCSVVFVQFPVNRPWTDIPWVDVQPWRTSDKLKSTLHHDDRDIGCGNTDFDKRFRVRGNDRDFAAAVLPESTRAMIRELELGGFHMVDDKLFLWREHFHLTVERLTGRLDAAVRAVGDIPVDAWQRYGVEPPAVSI